MNVLVTGGLGFIGSNLVRHLNAIGGVDVTICDNLNTSDKWKNGVGLNIRNLVPVEGLDYLLNDQRFDVIFHMGARSDTREQDLKLLYKLNFESGQKIFQAAARTDARLIYASSAATYGDGSQGWKDTTSPLILRPLNPYGYFKNQFDAWAMEQDVKPTHYFGLKFFNVYGDGEAHKGRMASAIFHFLQECMRGEPVRLFRSLRADVPDGMQRRDFVWIGDVVEIAWRLAVTDSLQSGLLNVGSGVASTFLDIVDALSEAVGFPVPYEFFDMPPTIRPAYQYFSQADTTNTSRLDVDPTGLSEGVRLYFKAVSGVHK